MKKLLFLFLFLLPLQVSASSVLDVAGTDLTAFWRFEEESGVREDSFASYDLNDNNTVGFATGIQGNAADFESSSLEYFSRSVDDAVFDFQSQFTVALWFKLETLPTTLGYSPALMAKEVSNSGWNSRVSGGDNMYNWVRNDMTTYDSTTVFTTGVWYFLVITKDSTNMRVYVNGVQESSSAYSAAGNTTAFLNVGRSPFYTSRYWDGLIDEVGVWSTALSSTTIVALYNAGLGLPYDSPTVDIGTTTSFFPVSMLGMLDGISCSTLAGTTTCSFDYATSAVAVSDAIPLLALSVFVALLAFILVLGVIYVLWISRA